MNNRQLYFTNDLKTLKHMPVGKNGSSKLPGILDIITENYRVSENNSMLRIKELEGLNKHLENQIDQRTRELSEMVVTHNKYISIISHDLRSPFASIISVFEIIKDSLNENNNEQIENLITLASSSANRTLTLLDNLLAWSISQNKENSFHPVKINLHKLIEDEIEGVRISAELKQISLNYVIALNLNVTADLQMIKTVFRNLISNAVKYTNMGGEINISAIENKSFVEIVVKDSGIGISQEAQKNLFKTDVFNTKNGTSGERGTGLGLLLCKEFVELHGGNIQIESEPGNGTKFKFSLPHYI